MIFNVPGHIGMIRNGLFWYDGIDKPDWSLKEQKKYHTYRTQFLADRSDISKEAKKGLHPLIIKTQTRRLNRGIYQIGKDYAVQQKRGVKAEADIRIVMDEIWLETNGIRRTNYFLDDMAAKAKVGILYVRDIPIFERDAWAEGGYTSEQYEKVFQESSPKWNGKMRWAFKFHVEEVQNGY